MKVSVCFMGYVKLLLLHWMLSAVYFSTNRGACKLAYMTLFSSLAFCVLHFASDRFVGARCPTIPWDQDQTRGLSCQTGAVGAPQSVRRKERGWKCRRFGGLYTLTCGCLCACVLFSSVEWNLQDIKTLRDSCLLVVLVTPLHVILSRHAYVAWCDLKFLLCETTTRDFDTLSSCCIICFTI